MSNLQSGERPGKRRRIAKKVSKDVESVNETAVLPLLKVEENGTNLDKSPLNGESFSCIEDQFEEYIEEHLEETPRPESSSSPSTLMKNVIAVPSCSGCKDINKQLQTLTKQTFLIRALVANTLREVRGLKKEVSANRAAMEPDTSFFSKYDLQFPLTTRENLKKFEIIMHNETQFRDAVKELANLGGSENYDFVKRALSTLISNDVAVLFSWLGRKGKEDFHKLNTARLVIYAAEQGKMAANRRETELSIQAWLKRASDRRASSIKKF